MDFDFVEAFGEALPPTPSTSEAPAPPRTLESIIPATQAPVVPQPTVLEAQAPAMSQQPIPEASPAHTETQPTTQGVPPTIEGSDRSIEAATENNQADLRKQYSQSIDDILQNWKKPRRTSGVRGGMVTTQRPDPVEAPPTGTQDAMSFEEALGASSLPHTVTDAEMRKFTEGTDTFRWDAMIQTMRRNRKPRAPSWSIAEKKLLVRCLQQFGLDFTSIAKAFPERSRVEVRKMFKAMNKTNPSYVSAILRQNAGGLSVEEMRLYAPAVKKEESA